MEQFIQFIADAHHWHGHITTAREIRHYYITFAMGDMQKRLDDYARWKNRGDGMHTYIIDCKRRFSNMHHMLAHFLTKPDGTKVTRVKTIEMPPIGTLVELERGEFGIVKNDTQIQLFGDTSRITTDEDIVAYYVFGE
jgi:hypothetical protein